MVGGVQDIKNIKFVISWLLVIIWMIVIFLFSAQNGEESGELSNKFVTLLVLPILDFLGLQSDNLYFVSLTIRKMAHMFVYFILAILSANAMFISNLFADNKSNYITALVISFLYAISDEFHQGFSPGRSMSFVDVLIDSLGACIGLLVFFIVVKIFKLYKLKPRR